MPYLSTERNGFHGKRIQNESGAVRRAEKGARRHRHRHDSLGLDPIRRRAKNEQGKLYSRIAELENILLHAVIVDETDMDSDKVSIGCRVTVTNLDNGKTLPEYTIVGSQEANVMERKVSEDSPFGKALMGSKAGSEITVEAPKGVIRYRVDKIER